MILGHDHTIYLVADPAGLDAVCDGFRTLGFTITERDDEGRAQAPTMQKLICFEDGSYIEILTIRDAEARRRHRFAPLLATGNGWADYSLRTDDLAAVRTRLTAAMLPFGGPHSHVRKLADGRPWGVDLILPGIGAGHPALPFVLEDRMGRDLRIPRHAVRHANGVTGTAGVTVAARDVDAAAGRMSRLFGPDARIVPMPEALPHGVRVAMRQGWIDLVEAMPPPGPGLAMAGGEGVVGVALLQPGADERQPLRTEATALPGLFATGTATAPPR